MFLLYVQHIRFIVKFKKITYMYFIANNDSKTHITQFVQQNN